MGCVKLYRGALRFAVALLGVHSSSQAYTHLQIMTHQYAPFSFAKDGGVRGISADILVLLLEKIGSTQSREDFELHPWARAFKLLREQPNTVLFTVARTTEREQDFKCVAPILQNYFQMYALKERGIKIKRLQDLRKYKIGTIRDDVFEEKLAARADMQVSDFQRATNNLQTIKQLRAGSTNLIVQNQDDLFKICRENGLRFEDYEPVFLIEKRELYYAFHKDTSSALIKTFQDAFVVEDNEINQQVAT